MSRWIGKTNNVSDGKQNPYALSNIFQGNVYSQTPSLSNFLWQKPTDYDLQTVKNQSGRFLSVRA
jgi:hypothetical protein